jgi:hypothetical protein
MGRNPTASDLLLRAVTLVTKKALSYQRAAIGPCMKIAASSCKLMISLCEKRQSSMDHGLAGIHGSIAGMSFFAPLATRR